MGTSHADPAGLGLLVSPKLAQTPCLRHSLALSLHGFKSPPAFLLLRAHPPALGTSTSKPGRGKHTGGFFKRSSVL